ncbi:MAG: IclR family transcriptional regulator [Salinarimonas sp.]
MRGRSGEDPQDDDAVDGNGDGEAAGQDVGKDRQFVTALARGLEVLRAFRPGDVELGNWELAERTGLPKPTVVRLTYTLTRLGYLVQTEAHGRYRLGVGVLALGYALLTDLQVRERARPLMQALADEVDASVSLGSRDRLSMVYVETCRGPGHITLRLDVGDRVPLGRTAMGRAFLAALPEPERAFLLDHLARREGDDFPAVVRGVEQAMRDLAEKGFVVVSGDWQPDISAVGVPLVMPNGQISFALNCGTPAFLSSRTRLEEELGPKLARLARRIGTADGG